MRVRTVVMAVVAAAGVTVGVGAAAQAQNPPCYAQGDGSLKCGNYAPRPIYNKTSWGDPDNQQTWPRRVDTLRSNPSWFKCYIRGEKHSGGNNVWYYTQGDDSGRYGWVPASTLYTPKDPFPGVKKC
ncbi:hypothetical protein ACIBHY_19535 [Nonomuraea sp. NPDC050547]|uniref:hypothetical protein n=1 Tax=unclassified Nonomuraea TaxID=2593643 RepID=UPI0037AFFED9